MEASLVLPVLIFAVITVVLIIMFFYSQMTQRSQMHIALRQEAGRQTETMTSEHVYEKRDGRSNGNREEILADGAQRNLDKEGRFCCQGELQRCGCSSICAVLQPCQGDKK